MVHAFLDRFVNILSPENYPLYSIPFLMVKGIIHIRLYNTQAIPQLFQFKH